MRAVEHYREAERQIEYAEEASGDGVDLDRSHLLCAQAHATLALAGATAMASYVTGDSTEPDDWELAVGGKR